MDQPVYPTRLFYQRHNKDRLLRLGTKRQFPPNYLLARPGVYPEQCYLVLEGQVIAFGITPNGDEHLYNFMEQGALILDGNILTQQPVNVYFKTVRPSELVCIRREPLLAAITSDPLVAMDVIESLQNKFESAMNQVREMNIHSSTWRVCNLLRLMAKCYGTDHDGKIIIREKLSQQLIANTLYINRVTVAKILKKLKESHVIEQIDGYYCIRSLEQLQTYQDTLEF